jgi:hypothetical protein
MAALQSELREQKAAAKAAAKEHENKAHLRAMVAHDEAQKGRPVPVGGAFVSASSLFPDPASPSGFNADIQFQAWITDNRYVVFVHMTRLNSMILFDTLAGMCLP